VPGLAVPSGELRQPARVRGRQPLDRERPQQRERDACASMTSEFEELARPRTGSREATDGAGGSGYVDRPPPNARRPGAPFTAQASRMRGRRQPQLITSSTCQRQRLSRCSWQRVPRVPGRPGYQGLLLVPGLRGPGAQLHGDGVRPLARGAAAVPHQGPRRPAGGLARPPDDSSGQGTPPSLRLLRSR
jgi:hypothetical protein